MFYFVFEHEVGRKWKSLKKSNGAGARQVVAGMRNAARGARRGRNDFIELMSEVKRRTLKERVDSRIEFTKLQ